MSILIVAEKPSVANAIAETVGAQDKKNGYKQGNGYIVSWCVGHLVSYADPSAYDEKYQKWKYDDLPIMPKDWILAVLPATKNQFFILKQLMNQENIDYIICATDAGREGELIFRLVYEATGCKKEIKRLWISSMEQSEIRAGIQNMKTSAEYEGLYQAALCRAKADWLVGLNMTRLFSILYNRKLQIGRVMTPTLSLIVQREADIEAFSPTAYYNVNLELEGISFKSKRIDDQVNADALLKSCNKEKIAVVKAIEEKEKKENAPLLYDLTTLQREANRYHQYTAQQSLDYVQSLYEKKLCTYPRTDSRFLSSDMICKLPKLVDLVKALSFTKEVPVTPNFEQLINNKKVTDHHAIIPTMNVSDNLESLPTGEKVILEMICRRLLCSTMPPVLTSNTIVTVSCAEHEFIAKTQVIKSLGWKEINNNYPNSNVSPDKKTFSKRVVEGQELEIINAELERKKTKPPGHFTEDTLLSTMESVVEVSEEIESKGLGTPATRAAILEKLISIGFVERQKGKKGVHLIPTHAAISLITVLPQQIQSPLMTADWEYQLKQIERGEIEPEQFISGITNMLRELIKNYKAVKGEEVLFLPSDNEVGTCPRCSGKVIEHTKGFSCQQCGFAIWKEDKFFTAKKYQLTLQNVAELLEHGTVHLNNLYSNKTGKRYSAWVTFSDTGLYVNYRLEFKN